MKKSFTRTSMLLCGLLIFNIAGAWGQTAKLSNTATGDDEDTVEAVQPVKKKLPPHASIGMEVGYNNSYLITNGAFNSSILSWCAGLFAYIPITGHLYFQPGLYYSVIGGASSDFTTTYGSSGYPSGVYKTTETDHIQIIEVPLVLGFKYGRPRRIYQGSFTGIGANVAYCVGGNYSNTASNSSETNTGSLRIGTDAGNAIVPYMAGAVFFTGAQYGHITLRVRAAYTLTNLAPQGKDNAAGNQTVLQPFYYGVQLGYVFGKIQHRPARKRRNDPYLEPRM